MTTGAGAARSFPARAAAVLAVFAVLAVALVVGWAATAGPDQVLTGDGPQVSRSTTASPTEEAEEGGGAADAPSTASREVPWWVRVVAWVMQLLGLLVVVALLGVLVWLAKIARERWQGRRRYAAAAEDVGFEVLGGQGVAGRLAQRVRGDADEQTRLLETGEPGDAIVACWLRFEEHAELAGLARAPAETSSEFALRALDLIDGDPTGVSRLAALYREARFSEHVMSEADRAAAREALAAVHASLSGSRR